MADVSLTVQHLAWDGTRVNFTLDGRRDGASVNVFGGFQLHLPGNPTESEIQAQGRAALKELLEKAAAQLA